MNSPKLNVWRALSKKRLVRPFIFDDDIVDGENYLSVLRSFFMLEVRMLKKFVQSYSSKMEHLRILLAT